MKEKNKKFKFKKWYLMPIFVVAFLCVFGFSIVKPVKAEYYTHAPTDIGNTQYAFNVSFESSGFIPDATYMFPTEVYNYTETSNPDEIATAIAVRNPISDEVISYGYVEQTHTFVENQTTPSFSYTSYINKYHFISLFTSSEGWLTFTNEDFYFIPHYADIFTNFDFTQTPYYNSIIYVNYNDNSSNYYMNLLSCEFTVEVFVPTYDNDGNVIGTHIVENLITYDFDGNLSYTFNNGSIDVYTDILRYYPNQYILYPYKLVDYLIDNHYPTVDFFHITNFKIFTVIPPQTQFTGIDEIYQTATPITRNASTGFNITDYTSKITLNSYNIGASEFLQYEIYSNRILQRINVDTTSWLLTAVGAFMNAELFPGFAIGGIFAVMVAFPLVIWFLKVVLGG